MPPTTEPPLAAAMPKNQARRRASGLACALVAEALRWLILH